MPKEIKTICSLKRLFVALTIFVVMSQMLVAQVEQYGIVKEYRGAEEKVPLSGVEVNVMNAASTASGPDGQFVLQFRTLHPGDLVKVRRIEKAGYEIFNKEALEQWIISGRKDIPFTIVMCRVAQFKQMRDNYERVSSANYEAQYKKEQSRLAQKRDQGQISQAQYETAERKAKATLEKSKAQVSVVAEKFSRIDLSEVSKSEREVITMVQQGKIEEAIITAEERGNMIHLADLYQLAGGVENMEKADSLLRRAALSDTTQLEPMEKFARFAYSQSDWSSARRAYEVCLRHTPQEPVYRAPLAHNLGLLYLRLKEPGRARRMLEVAKSDFLTLAERDPEGWQSSLASVRLSIAAIQMTNDSLQVALESLREVIASCQAVLEQDTANQTVLRHLVHAENNVSIICLRQQNYSEAQKMLHSALLHVQLITGAEIETAAILNSIGNLYLETGHLPEAETRLKQSERMLLPQMVKNPQGVMPDLARCYYNLYRLCRMQNRQKEAASYRETAITQYRILAERQPEAFGRILRQLEK